MIAIIARHECTRLLHSAQTWIMAALLTALFGFLFLKHLEGFLDVQTQLAAQDHPVGLTGYMSVRYLEPLALVFTLVAPLFAMRSFSDEFRNHTLALWQSSPVSSIALVAGKFIGVFLVLILLVILATGMLVSMRVFVSVDISLIASATLGLLLCTSACAACGLFFSSLTQHSLVAIIASLTLLMFSWMLGSGNFTAVPMQSLAGLSIANHLRGFFQGYVQTGDIAFFLLMTLLFLCLSVTRLDAMRQTGR